MKPARLGRYEILREIGRGAMGVVYSARDPVLDRSVAVKTIALSVDGGDRADYEARFLQEAKAAGAMAYPNIVTVYDVGRSADVAFMAMELLEGEELGTLMRQAGGIPIERAVDIAAQIAEGLAYAHERGVVHRDIKPPNIMILKDGLVKITDFGIARHRASPVHTQTGLLLGSPRYMSPEVFLGERADGRSDIFSLGILLYEMLVGATPFSGDTVSALMHQTLNVVPPAPSAVRASVPAMLDFIVAKTLAKKPQDRYADARALATDLRECGQRMRDAMRSPAAAALPDVLNATLPLVIEDPVVAAAPAPTLGISRDFDSLRATQRLAVNLGAQPETLQASPGSTGRSSLGTAADAGHAAHYRVVSAPAAAWTRRDLAVFSTGVCIALVIAVFIALG
jgi:serine/threonine-protein kinase